MKLQLTAVISALIAFAGLGVGGAIAIAPQPVLAQNAGVCRQMGTEYLDVYIFETETHYVTICQKGKQYYYIEMPKTR